MPLVCGANCLLDLDVGEHAGGTTWVFVAKSGVATHFVPPIPRAIQWGYMIAYD